MKDRKLYKKGVELRLIMIGKNKRWLKEKLGLNHQQHLSNILRGAVLDQRYFDAISDALKLSEAEILKYGKRVERETKKYQAGK